LGAEVVAFDLSESLTRLSGAAVHESRLHLVQGDLMHPPFRECIFDTVYSQGVLHHTPDTRAAFRKAAELVKPGGFLSVWVYGRAGYFSEFASNPLREERAKISHFRRLAWLVVAIRHSLSDVLRVLTTRLPLPITYVFCHFLALLGAVPGVKFFTFSVHPLFRVRLIENFDWLTPPFQYHHTKEELSSWFQKAGFEVLKILPHGLVPKPGILGRKRLGDEGANFQRPPMGDGG
jgi:SAM-dependent methyltransferase